MHGNEAVEVAVREWLHMQGGGGGPISTATKIFEVPLRWDKWVAVFRDCAEK